LTTTYHSIELSCIRRPKETAPKSCTTSRLPSQSPLWGVPRTSTHYVIGGREKVASAILPATCRRPSSRSNTAQDFSTEEVLFGVQMPAPQPKSTLALTKSRHRWVVVDTRDTGTIIRPWASWALLLQARSRMKARSINNNNNNTRKGIRYQVNIHFMIISHHRTSRLSQPRRLPMLCSNFARRYFLQKDKRPGWYHTVLLPSTLLVQLGAKGIKQPDLMDLYVCCWLYYIVLYSYNSVLYYGYY